MKLLFCCKPLISGLLLAILSFNSIATEKFRVCADPLNPPYSTKAKNGFENKIAELLAKKLKQTVKYYWFPQRIGFIRNTLKSQIGDTKQYQCDIVMGLPVGFDFAKTTKPYYRSQYVLLIAKERGWDDITRPSQLANLSLQREQALKIAMFDRGPGTAWLQKQGLLEYGIPYQTMTGDDKNNTAMLIEKDIKSAKIDMVIIWGPMAGYIVSQSPHKSYRVLAMQSTRDIKFDFAIAMGVRYGDNKRKAQLDHLIAQNSSQIQAIIAKYNVPLLALPKE